MAEYSKVKLRFDSQANWLKFNPVLLRGELSISQMENDEIKIKIGDGTTAYALLPFFGSISKEEIEALLGDYAKKSDIPTANSELTNDSNYITISDVELKNYTTLAEVAEQGYLNSEQVTEQINSELTKKDFASNTRVNEIEAKIPTNTVTAEQLQAVKTIVDSKTTLAEVNEQGFVKNSELATVAKTGSYNDLSDRPNIPEGVIVDQELNIGSTNAVANKAVVTKLNTMDSAIASKTTMGEVEAKQFQTAEQIEQTINSKNYTTLEIVNQQGFAKGTIPTDNATLTNGAGYQNSEQVQQAITEKDFANNTRVNEIEAKIPTDTVTAEQLQAVETIANSKTTLAEVAEQGYAKKSEIPAPIVIDTELSESSENPVQNKILTEKLNTLKGEVDSKTTMGEVEAKGYTTLAEVGEQGYAKDSEVPKTTEQWSFTMEDGSTVTKDVYIK